MVSQNLEKKMVMITVHHRLHEEDSGFHRCWPSRNSARRLLQTLGATSKTTPFCQRALPPFDSSRARFLIFFHFYPSCPKRRSFSTGSHFESCWLHFHVINSFHHFFYILHFYFNYFMNFKKSPKIV